MIEQIIRTERLVVEDIQIVRKALEVFRETKADFAACLISRSNLQTGCLYTATMDDAAAKTEGYISI